ncbi:zinc-ribbon domain-containing protein [Patescibacteria group bacterium]|nr:zinc-ribbon domain-containing protein [Patescibacteria group bacterium]MBU1673707.1 zinc-ribbon domain-containing protein [Patescibacteria group bacterium]MBU1963063.1 zinc-ribbon domain-containing protein [Patescibacteria group bacterium]
MTDKSIKCNHCGVDFIIRAADAAFYDKTNVPDPTHCPECREQRRMTYRNERTLHLRACDCCEKEIISIYHKDCWSPVYCYDCWMSEKWSASDYAQEFDFKKPFFDQFLELRKKVPRLNLFNTDSVDSEFTNQAYYNKNCYLCFGIRDSEDSFFTSNAIRVRNTFDSEFMFDSHNCYECIDCFEMDSCTFAKKSRHCKNSHFLYDANECEDCIACVGLRKKKYHIFNKPYSKEAYEKFKKEYEGYGFSALQDMFDRFLRFVLDYPRKCLWMKGCEKSLGNNLYNSVGAYQIFDGFELKNCAYSSWIFRAKDCYDVYGVGSSEKCYESVGVEECFDARFSVNSECCSNITYSDICLSAKNLFGCIGVKRNKFMILNKKYLKQDYDKMTAKIIGHMKETGEWGEFFPMKNSPFCYNVTIAQDYFPMEKKEILGNDLFWRDLKPLHKGEETIDVKDLADKIQDVKEDIIDEVLYCEDCEKNYQILQEEVHFYKKFHLPIPRKCPDCRHKDRLKLRSPHRFWERECACCGKIILCTYPPEKPDIVYCDQCYRKEITYKQNGPPSPGSDSGEASPPEK